MNNAGKNEPMFTSAEEKEPLQISVDSAKKQITITREYKSITLTMDDLRVLDILNKNLF